VEKLSGELSTLAYTPQGVVTLKVWESVPMFNEFIIILEAADHCQCNHSHLYVASARIIDARLH
jgi:hypothetical protein